MMGLRAGGRNLSAWQRTRVAGVSRHGQSTLVSALTRRTGSVIVPIYATSTFAQDGVGGLREGGYEYSRTANPTRTALEESLASLEGGRHALAFASGMAAADIALRAITRPGDHVILGGDAYGGTFRLLDKVLTLWGVEYTTVDLADVEAARAAVRPNTKVIWCETPTNPLLGIADIAALAQVAVTAGAKLVVDNTFATPVPAVAARPRRRRGAALDHQVPRRPLRRRRRRADHLGRRRCTSSSASCATRSAPCRARSTRG